MAERQRDGEETFAKYALRHEGTSPATQTSKRKPERSNVRK
jgi:hypothetical protein